MLVALISSLREVILEPLGNRVESAHGVDAITAATWTLWIGEMVAPRSAVMDRAEFSWKVAAEPIPCHVQVLEWQPCCRKGCECARERALTEWWAATERGSIDDQFAQVPQP